MALAGKTALVTGSTSGIGLGIALALARQGARLILNGFGDTEGPVAQVKAAGSPQVGFHGADMSNPAAIAALMAYADAEFGGVDVLVNNAGIQHVAPVQDFPPERWDAVIAINLSSAFHTTRLALPGMLAKGWGRIINLASVHGLVASMPGKARRVVWKALERLMAMTASQRSGGKSCTGATCWMPALLTSTSTPPNSASA
jgi:3-hydroxybutyrate dehydrogenase